jgi:RhoGEF domain
MCNFVEVVTLHEELLKDLEECNDKIGKLFLSKASLMKRVHQTYCIQHPKAIVIVDKFKENLNMFMEKQGAAKPGILVLTTGLSKCFRRLDKYAAILQEMERHMESGHADRGDTQRSISVFKEIAASSSAIRRQKELELQILTGPIRGWEGDELSTMGEILHMGSVAVGKEVNFQKKSFLNYDSICSLLASRSLLHTVASEPFDPQCKSENVCLQVRRKYSHHWNQCCSFARHGCREKRIRNNGPTNRKNSCYLSVLQ